MKNKKGFTLIEVMTVVFIIGILVALSLPFLIGYVRDARNDRAKSILHLLAQGYKNFATDFSRASTHLTNPQNGLGNKIAIESCDISKFTGTTFTNLSYKDLIYCSYIPNLDYANTSYQFYLGPASACCQSAATNSALACMKGNDSGEYGTSYCAYIAENGGLREEH